MKRIYCVLISLIFAASLTSGCSSAIKGRKIHMDSTLVDKIFEEVQNSSIKKEEVERAVEQGKETVTNEEYKYWSSYFLEQNWSKKLEEKHLPQWFDGNRVQGHTRFMPKTFNEQGFSNAGASFRELGAKVFTRHVKSGEEDPWWPSLFPVDSEGKPILHGPKVIENTLIPEGHNIAQEIIDEAHKAGTRIFAYYWHMSDKTLGSIYPQWLCEDLDGKEVEGHRGAQLCLNTPYRDAVLQRLLELVEMGVDGIFFDSQHMPPDGCWCDTCQLKFTQLTGLKPPNTKKLDDPVYQLYMFYKSAVIDDTFDYWSRKVHEMNPNVVMCVSSATVPSLGRIDLSTNIVRIADSSKNEYHHAFRPFWNRIFDRTKSLAVPEQDIRMAIGFTLMRDSADGRPFHIWTAGLPNYNHTMGYVSSILTYGGIANMDVSEDTIATKRDVADKTSVQALKSAFALGDQVSPYLADTQPLRWAAVHYSELSRNLRAGNDERMWREVLWPFTGAFGVLSREALPVGIVNDYQLQKGQLDGYKVLFLPNPDELTPEQKNVIDEFKKKGGIVLKNNPEWDWSNPDKLETAKTAFKEVIQKYKASSPIEVNGSMNNLHVVPYIKQAKDEMIVCITQNFDWVQISGAITTNEEKINEPPTSVHDVKVTIYTKQAPKKVFDAVSGKQLTVQPGVNCFDVFLPEFQFFAVLVMNWQ